ncbi:MULTISPECIES: VOC family protein [unclassified Mesorhizobium]|uniref:VOC family protein n=1 Tax=unclassified Mesorhizobium TaxID=325217 RepID=UPI0006FA664D|nr:MULTISPECIES: VOC family protein [unclassified Mesorhizobium]KQZ14853.1 3-demethylubiquinone-9 3-methyltransferase [Mesorhizobium sp. Root1471]KQZ37362.1 3-demethylubiquinone-9 3-methyltransferase [Mesorhizobium sp. Root554]MDR7034108.1 putative 3-demethylubiquinone-9 3-methyltransferase (glyoxalase superfamily) [Mesorhizobium sp. BE184]
MTLSPFLMFEGRAEEALTFYCETIPDSRIIDVVRYGPGEPGPAGTVKTARAAIAGLEVMASDSHVHHAFTFTPSISLFMNVDSEAELERIVAVLAEGGGMLMPIGDYGFSRRFAWLNDRFGVSWQINLP